LARTPVWSLQHMLSWSRLARQPPTGVRDVRRHRGYGPRPALSV